MDYGVHLPLIDFDGTEFSLGYLLKFTERAEGLGFDALAANDHLLFPRPWLDGPTALASVLTKAGEMTLATTVSLPIVRGPVAMAKSLAALDLLSGGRLIAGVGPGSSARDYEAVGIPFAERWQRLDESVAALRALWSNDAETEGGHYPTKGMDLMPRPLRPGGPPIWIGSWGSDAGIRRVARLADGWLASAYNTTPELFRNGLAKLNDMLERRGRDASRFPNALATMWCYVTEDRAIAEDVLRTVVAQMLGRDPEALRGQILVGPAEECREKLEAYSQAGVQRVFIWPVKDPLEQLDIFMTQVANS